MEDGALAAAAARGDQQAFAMLFERHRGMVYAIAYKVALNADDALDITQQAFLQVARKIAGYDGRGPFRAWLAVVATREALSFVRSPRRRERPVEPAEAARLMEGAQMAQTMQGGRTASQPTPRELAGDAERRRMVASAMEGLSPQQRAIVALQLREGLSPSEIAEQTGIPANQVRTQLFRAVQRLKELVGTNEGARK